MGQYMQKSLAISCLMHLLFLLSLLVAFFTQKNLKIGDEAPASVAISFVAAPEKEISKPMMSAPHIPAPIPPKVMPKVAPMAKKIVQKKSLPKAKPIMQDVIKAPHHKKIIRQAQEHAKIVHKEILVPEKKKIIKSMHNDKDEAKLGQMFAKQIGDCVHSKFNLVALGTRGAQLKIKAVFRLQKNGALQNMPDIQILGGDEHQRDIAYAQAVSALKACSPFALPLDKYYLWKDIEMLFDPYTQLN